MKKVLYLIPILVAGVVLVFVLNNKPSGGSRSEVISTEGNSCQTHTVIIDNSNFSPNEINAKVCDEIVFENESDFNFMLAFGEHDEHSSFSGFVEEVVKKGESIVLSATEKGSFRFHNHDDDEMFGWLHIK